MSHAQTLINHFTKAYFTNEHYNNRRRKQLMSTKKEIKSKHTQKRSKSNMRLKSMKERDNKFNSFLKNRKESCSKKQKNKDS